MGITLASVTPCSHPPIIVGETKRTCLQFLTCQPRRPVTQWCLAARPCLFRIGSWYGCQAHYLKQLHTSYANTQTVWHPSVSAAVLVAGLHQFPGCMKRICQSRAIVVTGGHSLYGRSLVVLVSWRRRLKCRIFLCETLKHLATSAALKLICSIPNALSLSMMVKRGMVIASYSLGSKVLGYVELTSDYRLSDGWFDSTPQVMVGQWKKVTAVTFFCCPPWCENIPFSVNFMKRVLFQHLNVELIRT